MSARSQAQSHLRFPLTHIFGNAGNVRVLRALANDPAPQSAPQLAQAAGLTPQGVRIVLGTLLGQRVIIVHGTGRAQLYALNPAHPLTDTIAALFADERQRWDTLLNAIRDTLAKRGTAVNAAWIYGSVALGEDSPGSDIDIAAIVRSSATADRLREDFMPLEDVHQVHISLAALTPRDLAALPENDPWWCDVVRDGRVLKGPAPRQARQRLAKAGR